MEAFKHSKPDNVINDLIVVHGDYVYMFNSATETLIQTEQKDRVDISESYSPIDKAPDFVIDELDTNDSMESEPSEVAQTIENFVLEHQGNLENIDVARFVDDVVNEEQNREGQPKEAKVELEQEQEEDKTVATFELVDTAGDPLAPIQHNIAQNIEQQRRAINTIIKTLKENGYAEIVNNGND